MASRVRPWRGAWPQLLCSHLWSDWTPPRRAAQVTWDESGDPPPVEPETLRACIPRDLRDRLAAAVRQVAESPEAALFAEPVEVEDYPKLIPVPMDLGLVVRRLEKVRWRRHARGGVPVVYVVYISYEVFCRLVFHPPGYLCVGACIKNM